MRLAPANPTDVSLIADVAGSADRSRVQRSRGATPSSVLAAEDAPLSAPAKRSTAQPLPYSLIGKEAAAADFSKDEQYLALCRQLDAENRARKRLEVQV